jgi:hypothetical protein
MENLFLKLLNKKFVIISLFTVLFSASCYSQKDDIYDKYEVFDSHFHITNYIQKGPTIQEYLKIMGDKVGRTALFGIPLQQQWSYMNSGLFAPKYYLDSDAPLYYYSFTDAYIAMQYKSLTDEEKKRFDPMITGFNPTDMYAVDHIKRVLTTFPGVFSGIGEFTIHKEFVSPKVSGETASLNNPALDSIFSFAGEAGLIVLLHNDIDKPFPKPYVTNYLQEVKELFRRHPETTIIWAHTGLGRVVRPIQNHFGELRKMLEDPTLSQVNFDISWDEVAKYIVKNDTSLQLAANLINDYPDRFLFGTDEVAPSDQQSYLKIYYMYQPLWDLLTQDAREKVKKGNFKRLFDAARIKVRAWENAEQNRDAIVHQNK